MPSPARRYDLDWLRIAAFGSLIFYHVGMFYVTWDWHVKSSRASEAIEPLMLFFNSWRLLLLFIISGVATRFMADKMSAGGFAKMRLARLVPPLLLAVFVIVPPQTYYEVLEALQATGASLSPTLDNFYLRYATASGHWCDADGCLITPTYNHMWFVAYLIIYTLALIALFPILRRPPMAIGALLRGPGFIVLPWLLLWVAREWLQPIFGQTHAFVDDWYLHAIYFTGFVFGFAIAKHDAFFAQAERYRWWALAITLGGYAAFMTISAVTDRGESAPEWLQHIGRGVRQLHAWTMVLALFGFAHRYLQNADGPVRRYFTEAIFPYYIVHQTLIVVAGHYLDDLALPLWLEASVLIATTFIGCALTYEIARRVRPLRPWFGLKSVSKSGPAPASARVAWYPDVH